MPHKDLEVRRAYLQEYKHRHRHRYRVHEKAYNAMAHANKRAARYGVPGTLTVEDVKAVLAVEVCHYCGRGPEAGHIGIDHVIPMHAGGVNSRENLVPACHSCNSSKYRQQRPGLWSREWSACRDCGTTERKHVAHGCCSRCLQRREKDRSRSTPAPDAGTERARPTDERGSA